MNRSFGYVQVGAVAICAAACLSAAIAFLLPGRPGDKVLAYCGAAAGVALVVGAFALAASALAAKKRVDVLLAAVDRHTQEAVHRGQAAARAQENERHQRILHDRVLQILEMLARGERRFDTGVRGQVAMEAAWLRDLVETGRERPPGNLVAELEALGVAFAAQGLRVELNTAGLAASGNRHDRLAPEQVAALAGAAREALANVAKHADTNVATVRATYSQALPDTVRPGITVTVVDGGRGFEPAQAEGGQGLRRSIIGRLTEAGGTVLIESAEGEGTSVELRMPLS